MLAISTFAAVRSANRSAQVTERALMASIRPVLTTTRFGDPMEKIGFQDDHWLKVDGGTGVVDVTPTAIYMGIALRNVGNGLAVLDRWDIRPGRNRDAPTVHVDHAHRLTRDLFIAAGDHGFWQGALRDPSEPDFAAVRDAINGGDAVTIDLLYGDHEGGQRTITRIALLPAADGRLSASVSRHWNLDRADPRHEGEPL